MKVMRKDKGVSEVLGSILVLLITVTLFSSVFYYVNTIPTPKKGTYSQFDAQIKFFNESGSTYVNITVENVGGESIKASTTMFIVAIDLSIDRHMLTEFGNQSFVKDGFFSQGEHFYYNSSWYGQSATPESNIEIMLYDKSNSQVIWTAKLRGNMNLPPVLVGVSSNPVPIQLGKYGVVKAIIVNPNSYSDVSACKVWIDLSSLNESSDVPMKYAGGNTFVTNPIMFHDTTLDVRKSYRVIVHIEFSGNNVSYSGYLYVTRGTSVKGADVFIDPSMIVLSDETPTHMEDVTVTVTVQNRGGTGAIFKLEVFDEYSGYDTPGNIIKIDTNVGDPMPANGTYTVAAAGQTTITFVWKEVGTNATGVSFPSVSGNHHLIVKAVDVQGVDGSPEEDRYPDTAVIGVTVLPKILFVDADQAIEGTPNDVSKYYLYMLDTCDYSYTVKRVMGDAVLSYDGTLRNYDVVIWETGYYGDGTDTNSAISSAQMSELVTFYNNGGSLWIISSEVSKTYLAYFGISAGTPTPYTGTLSGVSNPYVDLNLSTGLPIKVTLINDRSDASDVENVIHINPGSGEPLLEDSSGNVVGVGLTNGKGKLVYFGFEFSRIEHYYRQNFIGYRVLQWLGNITERLGNDVAIDDFMLSTLHPLYMQPVTITAVVSNNGGQPISTSVLLKIDGVKPPGITPNPNSTGIIPADGGFVYVNFTWIPKSPGLHTISLMADPFNEIRETNEENNYIDSSILDTNIYVEFSALVVYNSSVSDPTNDLNLSTLLQAFDDLGYVYQVLNVSDTADLPGDYASGDYYTRYNLVMWVEATGAQAGSTDNYIGAEDARAIYRAIEKASTEFMFIGPLMPEIMSYAYYESGNNLLDLFGISIMTNSVSVAGDYAFFGYNANDSPTNGLAFVVTKNSGTANDIDELATTNSPGYGLFRNPMSVGTAFSTLDMLYNVKSESANGYGVATVSNLGSKVMVVPFSMPDVKGIFGLRYNFKPVQPARQARAQLLFHELRWFGQLEMRPELAVYEPEISIQSELPKVIVKHSCMVQAVIHNFGWVSVDAVVRFYDDYEWIGTRNVYVAANNETTVEIVWTPLFASHARHIRVVVDPLNTIKEITAPGLGEVLGFNNEAIKTVTVWYFWDDMEHGAGNWEHEATILNINGETPLDFVDRKDVSTNVIGNWDWGMSGSSDNSGDFYADLNTFYTNDTKISNFTLSAHHTAPSAFWMPEAPRMTNRKPVDVIFVIDTSGSMDTVVPGATVGDVNGDGDANTRIDVAIQSAIDAVSELSDQDRVAIFVFNQNGNGHPQKLLDFTYATQANIQNTIDPDLTSLKATGGTPLYDTMADATEYMDLYGRSDAVKGILVMTDGLSNTDDEDYKYAPGTGYYETEPAPIQSYTNGNGLLNIPYSVMAISIAPNAWDGRLFPVGNSSTGNVSMALFESDPTAIEGAFTTFVSLLTQTASTGGIRAIPTQFSSLASVRASKTISSLGTVVFSDGFRDTTWGSPGFNGAWTQSGFNIASTNDGNYYYKSQSGGWTDEYWVAQTSTSGAYMQHTVYPYDVLHYHYPGSYTIVGASINFWVGDHASYSWWWGLSPDYASATINVYAAGQLLTSVNFDGGSYQEKYYTISIPQSIWSYKDFYDIKIEVSSVSGGSIGIDDVMVVYYIDYTPPSVGGTGVVPQQYLNNVNTHMNYTYFITPSVATDDAKSAMLSFWTKYWMTEGTNGGIMYLWGSDDGTTWVWDAAHRYYLTPKQSYTGNLKFSAVDSNLNTGGPTINGYQTGFVDANGNRPYWCFNGRSEHGTFTWGYKQVDLTPYISKFKYIRVVFLLVQVGGLTPEMGWNPAMGWYLDDVQITITSDSSHDIWQLHDFGGVGNTKAHSGKYAWEYNVSDTSNLPSGVDASLMTKKIDLTTARTVNLIFWIRFNINPAAGVPPATIRVGVSDDNGATWNPITYGVRIGWNASGTDTVLHDGKSYSGIPDTNFDGIPDTSSAGTYGWVESTTLMRINCDLSGWAGQTILLRFRVVTNATAYPTYDPDYPNDPYGVFLDDVFIYGESYAQSIPTTYIWD